MTVGQGGIVPFDAERLKRPHILRERLRATEPGVEVVDLLEGKHDGCGLRYQSSLLRPFPPAPRLAINCKLVAPQVDENSDSTHPPTQKKIARAGQPRGFGFSLL